MAGPREGGIPGVTSEGLALYMRHTAIGDKYENINDF